MSRSNIIAIIPSPALVAALATEELGLGELLALTEETYCDVTFRVHGSEGTRSYRYTGVDAVMVMVTK
jgi:hypothetical protein